MRFRVAFALFVAGAAESTAQTIPAAVRRAADGISIDKLRSDVEYLASDALRGRDTFSPGLDSAAQYIVRRLRRAGLRPAGDSGTFFQHYVVKTIAADTAKLFVEIGGQRFRFGDVTIFPFRHPIDATAPVVFVGHGARAPSRNIDAYAGLDIKGKFILAQLVPPESLTPGSLPPDLEGPRMVAERSGALGVLLLPTPRLLDMWKDMTTSSGFWSYTDLEPSVATGNPRITTSLILKAAQVRLLLSAKPDVADQILSPVPSASQQPSFEIPGAIRVHVPALERRRSSYNLVALLEGSDPKLKNEYVTVFAHLDGAVGNAPLPGDSIYNAADDNASGSAGMLAIAEQMLRAPRPRRSVMFVWDTGEERSLLGSHAFFGRTNVLARDIVTHVNIDMIGTSADSGKDVGSDGRGPTRPGEVHVVGPRVLSTALDSLVVRTNRAYLDMRLNRQYDHADSSFFYPRTDARPFVERSIPYIEFFTGSHTRYHRPDDEARYLDFNKIRDVSRTAMAVIWAVANEPIRPSADKGFPARVVRVRPD